MKTNETTSISYYSMICNINITCEEQQHKEYSIQTMYLDKLTQSSVLYINQTVESL